MRNNRKVLLLIATIVVAFALCIGTVVGWYFVGANVNVGIKSSVTSQGNLMIARTYSDDAAAPSDSSYKSSLECEGFSNLVPVTFENNTIKDFDGNVVSEGFVTLYLWFKSTENTAVSFSISSSSVSSISPDGKTPIVSSENLVGYGNEEPYNNVLANGELRGHARNTVRISFTAGNDTKIWEPNKNSGYCNDVSGECLASVYGKQIGINSVPYVTRHYEDYAIAEGDVLLRLSANTPLRLVVRLWIEGYDGDCISSIAGDEITTKLMFSGTKIESSD